MKRHSSRCISRPKVESLERKLLMAARINEFPIPSVGSAPFDIATGPDGNLWFTESFASLSTPQRIGRISSAGLVTEFPYPTTDFLYPLTGITGGPDGNVWFRDQASDKIGRITPTGTTTIFQIPISVNAANGARADITTGPDGNLWFTDTPFPGNQGRVGRITPDGTFSVFTLPQGEQPGGITNGPDGNLWFTVKTVSNQVSERIARVTPSGIITEFDVPAPTGVGLKDITTGPDGNLWFTLNSTIVGRITPTGSVKEFDIPNVPGDITTGSDGNLWVTEPVANKIGQITPSGTVTEFALPSYGSNPTAITSGPDGNIWFTEHGAGKIGQLVLSEFQSVAGTPVTAVKEGLVSTPVATFVGVSGAMPGDFSSKIIWGDGTAASTGVVAADGHGGFVVNGNHTYASAGSFTITATITDRDGRTATAVSQATVTTISIPPVLPPVTPVAPEILSVSRVGIHAQPTRLVLTFNVPLNPSTAGNVHNYSLVPVGLKSIVLVDLFGHPARTTRSLDFASATYDPNTRSVTLTLRHRLDLHGFYRLTVRGSGPGSISGTAGTLLDGAKTGHPGNDFVAVLHGFKTVSVSPPRIVPAGPRMATRQR